MDTIKTYDLHTQLREARQEIGDIEIAETDTDFVKSYWYYILFGNYEGYIIDDRPGNNGYKMYVIYLNGLVSGFSIFHETDLKKTIDLVIVDIKYRGHGLGTTLLRKCIKESVAQCQKVLLEVHADNTGAIRLYRKLGFKFTDCHGDYIKMVRR